MAKEKGQTVEKTDRDPAPIPIDPREESGQATPEAVHPLEEAPKPGEGNAPELDVAVAEKSRSRPKVAVGDQVEYCVGYRNAGLDKKGNSITEPVFTSATVVELAEDHKAGHLKLRYQGVDGNQFDAYAHHFAGRPGYWQLAGEEPDKDDEK